MGEHTPTPWEIYDDSDPHHVKIMGRYPDTGGAHVADVLMSANAAYIVKAVNNHAHLEREIGILISALRYLEEAVGERFDDEGGVVAEIESSWQDRNASTPDLHGEGG